MSSTGRTLEMTPLLPWRPAELVAWADLALLGDVDLDQLVDAGGSSWPSSRRCTRTSMTLPFSPWGTFRRGVPHLAGLLAEDGPQEALLGVSSVSPLGVTLPTRHVAGADLGADADDAPLVEVLEDLLGEVRDVPGDLSGPSLVSRASTSCSWMWIEVSTSSRTTRSAQDDGVLEVVALPRHEGHEEVLAEGQLATVGRGPSAMTSPLVTFWPAATSGFWLMQLSWLDRLELHEPVDLLAAGRPFLAA